MHLRKTLLELRDHGRQRVARLRMRGRDGQVALVLRREILPDPFKAFDFLKDAFDRREDDAARLRERAHALAAPREDLHAELVLELDDRLGHAGLRGVERLRRFCQVVILPDRLAHKAKLVEIHL